MRFLPFLFFIFGIAFSQQLHGQKYPYASLEKLYNKGKYDECIQKISEKTDKANANKKFWLYCLEMRCHTALYKDKDKLIQLKKAFYSGKKMMYKYDASLPGYATMVINEFREQLKIADSKISSDQELIGNIYSDIFKTFHTNSCAWDAFLYFTGKGINYKASDILEKAVNANYLARKNGDTSDFLYAYIYAVNAFLADGNITDAKRIYDKGTEVYPNSGLCKTAADGLLREMDNIGLYYSSNRQKIENWLEEMGTKDCDTKPASVAFYLAVFNTFDGEYDEPATAIDAAKKLQKYDPEKYGPDFFYSMFIQDQGILFTYRDSVILETIFTLKNADNSAKLTICSNAVHDLCINNGFLRAGSVFGYMKRHFPAEKTALANIKKEISSELEKSLKASAGTSRKTILGFYELNPKTEENKLRFIQLTRNFISRNIILKNYGECFRMMRSALSIFPGNAKLLAMKKEYMLADFEDHYAAYKSKFSADLSLTDPATCTPGSVTTAFQTKFTSMLNYCRRVAGLYDSCTLGDDYNMKAQKAALIMTANNYLTHGPGPGAKCYTADGAAGAGSSNLSLGHNGINALLGQLEDNGSNNGSVGHRRWILNPSTAVFGHGSAQNSMALYVFGSLNGKNPPKESIEPEFVAWPAADFFPKVLVPARWSFSAAGADFDSALVQVTQNKKSITVHMEKTEKSYGLPTIVWNLDDFDYKLPVEVKIKNVKVPESGTYNAKRILKTYTYTVELF